MATPRELVARLYIAYFNRAPDPIGLQHWVDDLNGGATIEDVANNFAGSTDAKEAYPYLLAPDALNSLDNMHDFINQVYLNVLARAADTDGLDYYTGMLQDGVPPGDVVLKIINNAVSNPNNDDAIRLQNKVDVGLYWMEEAAASQDQTYSDAEGHLTDPAKASAREVIDGVNETAASVAEGKGEADTFFATGQTFILSLDADLGLLPGQDFYGTEKNDTYIAGTVNSGIFSGNTLGTGDAFDGAGGTDLLQILDNGFLPLTPHTKNIEKVSLQALGPASSTVVLTNAQGVEEIINDRSAANAIFNSIQNNVLISVVGTSVDTQANFANGIDLGGEVNISVDGAGTGIGGNRANIYVSTDNAPTTLNIDASGAASFVRVEVDGTPGAGGAAVALETLNITGDADLNLRDGLGFGAGEFDFVTTVNVNSTGDINLDFSDNNQNVTYNGANGSGDDVLDFSGNGNNTIDTGAGNDWVDVSGAGNNTVNLGDGDDYVTFGSNATVNDNADGGNGIDTIEIDVDVLDPLTATSAFEGSIANFEKVYASDDVDSGEVRTVNLANLDDISYVITDGTDAGDNVEIKSFSINSGSDANGGFVLISGARVEIAANLTIDQVGSAIEAAQADIIANNTSGFPIDSVSYDPATNQVTVTYTHAAGNVPGGGLTVVNDTSARTAGVTFGATVEADGTTEVTEQQTLTVLNQAAFTGLVTVGGVQVLFTQGETTTQLAQHVADALNATPPAGVASAQASGNTVVVTYASGTGNVGNIAYNGGGTLAFANVAQTRAFVAPAAETQTVLVSSGADANGGAVVVGGVEVEIAPLASQDDVGLAIQNAEAQIIAANPGLVDVNYDLNTNTLTFQYSVPAGNVAPIVVQNSADTFTAGVGFSGVTTVQQGVNGGAEAGVLNLNNIQSGGTLELADDNSGHTFINLATQTANDSFNIILNDGIGNNNGWVHLDGIETLNVTQLDTDANGHNLGLVADQTTTVTVSGSAGVNFIDNFASLTSFDASGVTGTGAVGAVTVVTNAVANTSLTGGAGDDSLTGSNSAAHVDTINGGEGNDTIIGRAGADVLTGGAGNDLFVYQNVADSQGTTIDTITDFVSGQDKLDFSGVAGVNHANASYDGAANGYGAVLTALTADGNTHAVLDSSTSILYVDVNGDGILNNVDMAITLTGVTSLSDATDFNW